MKKVNELKVDDYIAFKWNYGLDQDEGGEIIVDNITSIHDDRIQVHFLYGYKSESEWVEKEDVLAIGNMEGKNGLKGWMGKFDILKYDHPLIIQNLLVYNDDHSTE